MPTHTRALTSEQYQALIDGLPVECPTTTFTLSGKDYSSADLVALAKQLEAANNAIAVAKATWLKAIAASRALEEAAGQTVRDARALAALMFKGDDVLLRTLGIAPRKAPRPLTVPERLAATEKAQATRKARGTKSKKQRSKIFGDVTGVTVTPVTRLPPPAPALAAELAHAPEGGTD